MKKKAFTLVEVLIVMGLSGIIFSFILMAIKWASDSLKIMARSEIHSQIKYLPLALEEEIKQARIILTPLPDETSRVICYQNLQNEFVVVFVNKAGLLTMYNRSKRQFRDLMLGVKSFKVQRKDNNNILYNLILEDKKGYEFNIQRETNNLNSYFKSPL